MSKIAVQKKKIKLNIPWNIIFNKERGECQLEWAPFSQALVHDVEWEELYVTYIIFTIYYSQELVSWIWWLSVVSTLFYVVFFAVGPGSITWMITAELFSQGPRPAAMSVAVLINWCANFLVAIGFPTMQVRNRLIKPKKIFISWRIGTYFLRLNIHLFTNYKFSKHSE